MADCGCEVEIKNENEKYILKRLLGINLIMFFAEFFFGIIAESTALMADSLDMLADASVYTISLYAVGKPLIKKINAAYTSGILQLLLGLGIGIDIVVKLITGHHPDPPIIVITSMFALAANIYCLVLINRQKHGEIHMRASWIFTKNDVLANLGVIIAGGLVYFSKSPIPDLIAGGIISAIILHGAYRIIADSREEKKSFRNLEKLKI
jgi:cation diffusion facilitator family transporter